MKKYNFQLIFLVLLGWGSYLNAQFTTVDYFTVANTVGPGISDEYIHEAVISPEGEMVFATQMGGIAIFDGQNWEILSEGDGLPNDEVYDIVYDPDGSLWICTEFALIRKSEILLEVIDDVPRPRNLLIDREGYLWVGTYHHGLYKQESEGNWIHFDTSDGLIYDNIYSLAADLENNIWIGTYIGLSRYDGSTFTNFTQDDGLLVDRVSEVGVDGYGRVWVASWRNGVSIYDGIDWTYYEDIIYTRDLYKDQDDTLWIVTNRIVYSFKDSILTEEYRAYNSSPIPMAFSCMVKTEENTRYFGTLYRGVLRINSDGAHLFYEPDFGLMTNDVRHLVMDEDGKIWMSGYRGISIYDQGAWYSLEFGPDLSSESIENLFKDDDGAIWVCSSYGALQFDGYDYTVWNEDTGLLSESVRDICQDVEGNYWFATYRGVSMYNGNDWTHLTTAEGLIEDDIIEIEAASGGAIWFSNEENIYRYDDGDLITFPAADFEPDVGYINQLRIDTQDRLWASTSRKLLLFDNGEWTAFRKQNGLPSDNIHSVSEDEHGNIWVAARDGLALFNGEEFTSYNKENGLVRDQSLIEMVFDIDRRLWIGAEDDGVFVLDVSSKVVEAEEDEELKIYPNPSNGYFIVESTNEIISVSIFEMNGRHLFFHENPEFSTKKLEISHPFPPGVYLGKIQTEMGAACKKLIITGR